MKMDMFSDSRLSSGYPLSDTLTQISIIFVMVKANRKLRLLSMKRAYDTEFSALEDPQL